VAAVIAPQDRAIVVGISSYQRLGHQPPADLQGPVRDAQEMASWLTGTGGAHVTLITSTGAPGKNWQVQDLRPRFEDVEDCFDEFIVEGQQRVLARKPARLARRLYVYMAGHGFAPEPRKVALIMADALGDTKIPNFEGPAWVDWFADQLHFDEFVLWMDCCATRTFEYPPGRPLYKHAAARQNGRAKVFMGFATTTSRDAYETKDPDSGEVRGVFTTRLLRGLNGAAADAKGEVTTASLVSYLDNTEGLSGSDATEASSVANAQVHAFPETAQMVFATIQLPTYTLHLNVADGTPVSVFDGNRKLVTQGVVRKRKVNVELGVGVFKAVAGGVTKLFEIASGTKRDVP
jgi:hypothetical protein